MKRLFVIVASLEENAVSNRPLLDQIKEDMPSF